MQPHTFKVKRDATEATVAKCFLDVYLMTKHSPSGLCFLLWQRAKRQVCLYECIEIIDLLLFLPHIIIQTK